MILIRVRRGLDLGDAALDVLVVPHELRYPQSAGFVDWRPKVSAWMLSWYEPGQLTTHDCQPLV